MAQVKRRPNAERIAAKAELELREAVERLGGEQLGRAPDLWLIRETLDLFNTALRNAHSQQKAHDPRDPLLLCSDCLPHGTTEYYLQFTWDAAVSERPILRRKIPKDGGSTVEHVDVPNAALELRAVTHKRPEAILRLIEAVENAAAGLRVQ